MPLTCRKLSWEKHQFDENWFSTKLDIVELIPVKNHSDIKIFSGEYWGLLFVLDFSRTVKCHVENYVGHVRINVHRTVRKNLAIDFEMCGR